jgi:hypothetical protein
MYKLFKDNLTGWEAVIRLSDGACIPKSEDNTDYLDGVVKGDQTQIDKYIADCQAVKAKYPKVTA